MVDKQIIIDGVDCIDCTLGGKAKLAEQILQLISEAENEKV